MSEMLVCGNRPEGVKYFIDLLIVTSRETIRQPILEAGPFDTIVDAQFYVIKHFFTEGNSHWRRLGFSIHWSDIDIVVVGVNDKQDNAYAIYWGEV